MSCNRPGQSRPFRSSTVWVLLAWLSITTRPGTCTVQQRGLPPGGDTAGVRVR